MFHYYLSVDQIPPAGLRFLLVNVAGSPAIESERVRKALQAAMPGTLFVSVTAGIVIGGAAAFFASRWLELLLFRQSVTDARVYGMVGSTMLLVAVVASAAPALRASEADPNRSLRTD